MVTSNCPSLCTSIFQAYLQRSPLGSRASCVATCLVLLMSGGLGAQEPASANIGYPKAVAVGSDGVRYVVDRDLPGVWRIDQGKAEVFAEGSKRIREPLNAPHCIAIGPNGEVYVGDSGGCNVYRLEAGKSPQPISSERIGIPMAIAVDSEGAIYVADIETHRIIKVTIGETETDVETVARVRAPRGLAFDAEQRLWIISGFQDPVRRLSADGSVEVIVAGNPLPYPSGIAIDADGKVWVADSYDRSLSQVTAEGKLETILAGDPLVYPVGIASSAQGLIVADPRLPGLWRIDQGAATQDFPQP